MYKEKLKMIIQSDFVPPPPPPPPLLTYLLTKTLRLSSHACLGVPTRNVLYAVLLHTHLNYLPWFN